MSKIYLTCLKCGYRFRPGLKGEPLPGRDWLVLAVIVFVVWAIFH
jgi:hypothetical protein